ncbi:MAG: hypothetical protein R3324_02545 [Halobacteriales archaeon]|nr:hypothetical protein [Halobacteriales archaeon]
MDEVSLSIPQGIVDSLPADGEDASIDMQRAVEGWERQINRAITASDEDGATGAVVDLIERFEDRWERYDEFVVELRAWGQSPIYAMAWRDLHGSLIRQLYEHADLADRIEQERHARIFSDGIRQNR